MKKENLQVEPPKIIGVLGEKEIPTAAHKSLSAQLTKQAKDYVCLPFKVEAKYLKNVIMCMKLMDIEGLMVVGQHQKNIGEFVTLDKSAQASGRVNLIKRAKGKFVGYYLEEEKGFYKEVACWFNHE